MLLIHLSPPSACDSALAYQIPSKLDDHRRSYDVISISQDGGHRVANLLPVSDLTFKMPKAIGIPNFDSTTQSTAKTLLLPVPENKRPPYYFTFGFNFDLYAIINIWFYIGLPDFMQIGWPPMYLWHHIDYKTAAIASQIYFRFLVWPCLTFKMVQSYRHTKFRPDISIHGRDITTSGSWKQTVTILTFCFWYQCWPFRCHWHMILHCSTNFYRNWMIANGVMTSYRFYKMGGHSVANLLTVSGLATSHI